MYAAAVDAAGVAEDALFCFFGVLLDCFCSSFSGAIGFDNLARRYLLSNMVVDIAVSWEICA